jgi:ribonucleoside-diphosphate reductase alpha chain
LKGKKNMSLKALQEYTYYSRYAGYLKEEKRRESWPEAVDAMMDMHLRRYPQVAEDIEWVRPLLKEKRVLGSQRALQFKGRPIEKTNARLYNCSASYCDRIRFFQEAFWLLLCGCGVGYSVQRHHIAKLPEFTVKRGRGKTETFVIPDSIEGWSDGLGILLATYFPHPEFPEWKNRKVKFDFDDIRPAGSPLGSGVGKAPGPGPLKNALEKIRELLDVCKNQSPILRPIDAHDIIMHAADAVLSGGVRRSSCLALFSKDDTEMATAKAGNWRHENPQRGRANNSALLLRGDTTKAEFTDLMKTVKEYGEPGFIWAEDREAIFNPCGEVGLFAYDDEGNSGWEMCNLSEINGRKVKCKEDFALAARAAAILGTLQAGYTDFSYLGETTEKIVRRESLLGVSATGMMDNPDVLFHSETQKEMAKLIVKVNEWMAKKIGINSAARCTCIKPSGTASCMLGSSSGVHPHHAKRYFRRVQGNSMETVLQYFKDHNPLAVEKSDWDANDTDEVLTFCVEVPDGAKTKNQFKAIDMLEHVKLTQQHWVSAGKRKNLCTQPWLTHNVSNTIRCLEEEWDEVTDYIYKNRKLFAGITLVNESLDLDYPQTPYCHVHLPSEILSMYGDGALMASGLVVDGLYSFDSNLWKACDAVLGLGDPLEEPKQPVNGEYEYWKKKMDWVRRVEQFAQRYCDGDLRKCTYLLKEVNNWKLWLDLKREYKQVPYEELVEETNETKLLESVACSNGQCEVFV